ncbi:MAG TPA: DJ-1/PfpI family protein [Candidatus Elarobacter sp.]
MSARIVIPIAGRDFDPSEVAVPWHILRAAGHRIALATPDGERGYADALMLTGRGLDPWGFVPGLRKLVAVGAILRADATARAVYAELERDPAFLKPLRYDVLRVEDFDALVLPGGHRAAGMRTYLESAVLQAFVADMADAGKPFAAICHGVVVAARARSPRTGRSVLYGRKTTSLTWRQERLAWSLGRVVRFWDPNYYRTYVEAAGEPHGARSVQAEVTAALASPTDYLDVPATDPDARAKLDGRRRDSLADPRPAFVVRDGDYVSARWPGDVHAFANTFADVLAHASFAAGRAGTSAQPR